MKHFLLQFRRYLAVAGVFSLAINLALLAPSIFMLQVFDRVLVSRSVETLVMLGLLVGLALVAMAVLDYVRARMLAIVGVQLDRQLAPPVLGRLIPGVARSGSRVYVYGMRDLASLRTFLAGSGVVALFDAPWVLIYIAVIFVFSPVLGLLSAAAAALLVGLAVLNERLTRQGFDAIQAGSREAGRFLEGAMRNAEAVTALGMQGAIQRRWQRMNDAPLARQLSVGIVGGTIASATRFSRQMIQVVLLGVGAYLVIEQLATPGVTIAATIILGRALAPVETLIASWKNLVEARSGYARLSQILAAPQDGDRVTELPPPTGKVEVENLVYLPSPDAKPILKGVSLSVEAGEVLALIGPSGSGKTTLARLLVGALRPSGGAVRLDGADIGQWDQERLGRWLGYLPQDVELFAGSVADNVSRLDGVDSEAVIRAAHNAHVHDAILRLPQGYDTPIGEAGVLLSGGQRQRVGLARALYGEPRIVVLDEPDASLDADGEQALLAAVRGLRSAGTTVIVVTQRRAMLALADRVAVLQDGRIERIASRQHGDEGRENVTEIKVSA